MMMPARILLLTLLFASLPIAGEAQTLADQLGYAHDAKLLMVHADDVGVTHSVNAATIKALEGGSVNSASIMVPCPWFPEIADYAKTHSNVDFGLHLVLTSERVYYRWGPVAPRDQVVSLVDANGYFHHDWEQGVRIDTKHAEIELRAQIARAFAMGIRPTHFDSHQYRLIQSGKELFDVFLRLAHQYHVPAFVARDWFAQHDYLQHSLGPEDLILDHTVTIDPGVSPDKWADFYREALNKLEPGVTEFVIHLAYDDEEMRAATRERASWGAAWRQRDFDFFTSAEFRRILADKHIQLVTWGDLANTAKNHAAQPSAAR